MKEERVSELFTDLESSLQEELTAVYAAGSQAMKGQDRKAAQKALDITVKLENFSQEVKELAFKWTQLSKQRKATFPEVKKPAVEEPVPVELIPEEVKPAEASPAVDPSNKIRLKAPKTGLSVKIPDGTVIQERKAADTFAKSIEKIGAERVYKLKLRSAGEQLVSRENSKLYPRDTRKISRGFFVLTHSSSKEKAKTLTKIGKLLGIPLEIQIIGNAADEPQTDAKTDLRPYEEEDLD